MTVGDVVDDQWPPAIFRHSARNFLCHDGFSEAHFVGNEKPAAAAASTRKGSQRGVYRSFLKRFGLTQRPRLRPLVWPKPACTVRQRSLKTLICLAAFGSSRSTCSKTAGRYVDTRRSISANFCGFLAHADSSSSSVGRSGSMARLISDRAFSARSS